MNHWMNRARAYWCCQFGGWGLEALGEIAVLVVVSPYVLWGVFINALNLPLGIALTHTYRAFIRWRGWTGLPLLRLAPRLAGATVVLSLAFAVGSTGIALAANPWSPFENVNVVGTQIVHLAFRMSPKMLLWSVLYFGVHYFWNYRSAAADRLNLAVQSREAKLSALRLQLNPHFLFNSLNSVRALVSEDPAQAKTMITRLARLLRKTLQSSKVLTVSLRDELRLARTYLELEAVRLEERLQFTIDADPATHEVPVPPLLVQTLVENAVKHGIATLRDGGCVRVTARCDTDNMLCVQVRNSGHLKQHTRDGGVGLQNLRERLWLLYGVEATLTLSMDEPGTVLAEARLPQHAPAAPDAVPWYPCVALPPLASRSWTHETTHPVGVAWLSCSSYVRTVSFCTSSNGS